MKNIELSLFVNYIGIITEYLGYFHIKKKINLINELSFCVT